MSIENEKNKIDNPVSFSNLWQFWIRPYFKFGLSGVLLTFAIGMTDIQEYAFALVVLLGALIVFVMAIHDWKGFEGNPIATNTIKSLLLLSALGVFICFGGVIYYSVEDGAWSAWVKKRTEKKTNAALKEKAKALSDEMLKFLSSRKKNEPQFSMVTNPELRQREQQEELRYFQETRNQYVERFSARYESVLEDLRKRGVELTHKESMAYAETNDFSMRDAASRLGALAENLPDTEEAKTVIDAKQIESTTTQPEKPTNIAVTKSQSEKPAFSEKTNTVYVSLGDEGMTFGFNVSQISKEKLPVKSGDGKLGDVYIENGEFYFDVDLFYAVGSPLYRYDTKKSKTDLLNGIKTRRIMLSRLLMTKGAFGFSIITRMREILFLRAFFLAETTFIWLTKSYKPFRLVNSQY